MVSRLALYVSEGATLTHYSINVDEAALEKQDSVEVPQEIQYAWVHPTNRFIYVGSSSGADGGDHHLTAFSIASDGGLAPLDGPLRLAHRPIHLTVDGTGRYLLTAYNRPSTATVHRIDSDGRFGGEVPQPKDLDGGYYAHQIRVLPSNRGAVLVTRGNHKPGQPANPGSLKICRFDDGILSNLDTVGAGDDFAPRHLDFHPTRPWVYVTLELANELQVFGLRDGRLTPRPLFTRTSLGNPHNMQPRQLAGAIHVHPNGRYVYVANRADQVIVQDGKKIFGGGENSIAVFEIDQASGDASLIQLADPLSFHVRCFALDPLGRVLATVSMTDMNVLDGSTVRHVSNSITVFRVGSDGRLMLAQRYDVDPGSRKQRWLNIVQPPV